MRLTILGRYGKYPNANGATCSYLVESKKTKILLDMGSASLQNLYKKIHPKDLDCIVLSHLHGDHTADAFVFRNIALELTKTGVWNTKLPFFMPNEPKNDYFALKDSKGLDVRDIFDTMKATIGDISLEFIKVNHPLPTFAIKLSNGKKTLSYTADIMDRANLDKLFENCDFALVDACILQKDHKQGMPHISVKEIAKITKDIPQVALTHLDYGKEEEVLQEALSQNKNAFLAEQLKTYNI